VAAARTVVTDIVSCSVTGEICDRCPRKDADSSYEFSKFDGDRTLQSLTVRLKSDCDSKGNGFSAALNYMIASSVEFSFGKHYGHD
jgi:hypothetical protein